MFLALSKFLLEGYEEYLWLGISCFERDVLNQILYFQGLSSICLLYDGFLNTRGYIHCIITTYERCPLIQPDWPCIAGRTAIACEQHFGLDFLVLRQKLQTWISALQEFNIMRPLYFHLTDTPLCSLIVVSLLNLTIEKVRMKRLTDFCSRY